MAAPITHLFFADNFWDKHQEIDRFQFFAGNCLPDIRYIDKTIERTKYHVKDITIDDVLGEKSDFWKGVKFHSFVDKNRDAFYENHKVYMSKVSDGNFIKSLKFLEDDILYGKLSFRQDFIGFFIEYEFPTDDIKEESIKKWKDILCKYFSTQPCKDSRKSFILGVGLDEDICNKIEGMLGELYGKYIQEIEDMIVFMDGVLK